MKTCNFAKSSLFWEDLRNQCMISVYKLALFFDRVVNICSPKVYIFLIFFNFRAKIWFEYFGPCKRIDILQLCRQHGQHEVIVEKSRKQGRRASKSQKEADGGASSKQNNSVCPSELAKMFWTHCIVIQENMCMQFILVVIHRLSSNARQWHNTMLKLIYLLNFAIHTFLHKFPACEQQHNSLSQQNLYINFQVKLRT